MQKEDHQKIKKILGQGWESWYLCHPSKILVEDGMKRIAQVAELVDAMVSNTIGETRAGSSPALGTRR